MKRVEPKVFLIGETDYDLQGMEDYLKHAGAEGWVSDAPSASEYLMEFYGRLCYRSWRVDPKLNPNITKIREGNDKYIANIINVKHGSVLEHAVTNWVFADFSKNEKGEWVPKSSKV
jgi:thymidylate synthase (FAD)